MKEVSYGRYSANVVIQKHNLIVTSTDIDLTLNCEFDLKQKVVTNQIQLLTNDVEGELISDEGNLGIDVIDETISAISETLRPPGQKPQDQLITKDKNKPHETTFHSPVSKDNVS